MEFGLSEGRWNPLALLASVVTLVAWNAVSDDFSPAYRTRQFSDDSISQGSVATHNITAVLGSVVGVQQRGRPPKQWTDNITDWTEVTCDSKFSLGSFTFDSSLLQPIVQRDEFLTLFGECKRQVSKRIRSLLVMQ